MVIFAIPIVTTLFTSIIGGITIHFATQNSGQDQRQENFQIVHDDASGRKSGSDHEEKGSERRSQQLQGIELPSIPKMYKVSTTKSPNPNPQTPVIPKQPPSSEYPSHFICPLTHQLLTNPVQLLCGHCFQKSALWEFLKKNKKCPVCQRNARFSEVYEPEEFRTELEKYKARRRARKLSHERLIEDFGDDKFQLIIGHNPSNNHNTRTKQQELQQKQIQLSITKQKQEQDNKACSDSQCEIIRPRKQSYTFQERILSHDLR